MPRWQCWARPAAAGGDPSFMNNVPDPTLRGQGSADLQIRAGEVGRQGHRQQLRQGGDRRATADLKGSPASRCGSSRRDARTAAFARPRRNGRSFFEGASAPPSSTQLAETNDFDPGDVWYFPRGHGHMLQCLGDKPCHFILIFDNGYFSEFGTFSITDWVGRRRRRCWPRISACPKLRSHFRRRKCISRAANRRLRSRRCRCRAGSCRRRPTNTACWRSRRMRPRGGREWRVDSSRFPIAKTITGVVLDLDPGAADAAGIRTPTSGSTSSRAR